MLLINLYPVAKGGGLQNAFSFLTVLATSEMKGEFLCLVRKKSELQVFCKKRGIPYKAYDDGLRGRLLFEFFHVYKLCKTHKPKVIFTLFGNSPIRTVQVKKVSGFARSNIIEQDRLFWSFLPLAKRISKQVTDYIILRLMRLSDVVIVETERLEKLCRLNNIFPHSSVRVVKMAASELVIKHLKEVPPIKLDDQNTIRILYITGSHPNKNIPLLAPIFSELNRMNDKKRYILCTTLPEGLYLKEVRKAFNTYDAEDSFENIGYVCQENIPSVIASSQAMINVAHLESFSNNWVEAWASRRLLICRDANYAKDSCFDAALYINLFEPVAAAQKINNVFGEQNHFDNLVNEGTRLLSQMPTAQEKFEQYREIIDEFL